MSKPDLNYCLKLLNDGLSLITVTENKIPNFAWKEQQTIPLTAIKFTEYYNYTGGVKKKTGDEIPKTENIGLVTGFKNIECIDVDLKVFNTQQERLTFWNEYYQMLSDNIDDFENKFLIVKTKNNGYHIIYKCDVITGNKKIARPAHTAEAVIESRGLGGYIFIYDNFVTKNLSYSTIPTISIEDREILWAVSQHFDTPKELIDAPINPPNAPRDYETSNIKPWEAYNSEVRIWDLISSEFTIVRKLTDRTIIRRNGAKSPHSGYLYNNNKIYLFSTGTIYPNQEPLSPFDILRHQKFGGNWKTAGAWAYQNGYGSRAVIKPTEIREKVKEQESEHDEIVTVKFPIDVFPIEIANYITQLNQTMNASIDYMGCSFLWMLSVIIGNAFKVEVRKGWIESVNIWIALIGEPGIGKTPSIKHIIAPLEKINSREVRRYYQEIEKFDAFEKLTKQGKDREIKVEKPLKKQFLVDDITIEALVQLHGENKNSVGIFKDELAGWFKEMNKYRVGSDLEHWLKSWSNQAFYINRKTSGSSFVDNPIMPVLGGIQPDILAQYFTADNAGNGFTDRLLTTSPELHVEKWCENEMSEAAINWYDAEISRLYEHLRNCVNYDDYGEIKSDIIPFSAEAKKMYIKAFDAITLQQNDENENFYMRGFFPKQKTYIARFALMLNTINTYMEVISNCGISGKYSFAEIHIDAVKGAIKLSKYFEAMARKQKIVSKVSADINSIASEKADNLKKYKDIIKRNPKIKAGKIAELLGVTRQTINRYKNESKA